MNTALQLLLRLRKAMHLVAGKTIGPIVWLCIIAYFTFYAIYGERGLLSMHQLEAEVDHAKGALATVRDERQRLEQRTTLLRPDSLDLDMVDERARQMLNMSHANDVIIMLPPRRESSPDKPAATR
ncbi:MAG: septum formation initiator family protein [Rhodospirillaceae bacterium]